jgi:hypothetical protein
MVDASGNLTPAWSFEALPPELVGRLNDESRARGFENGKALLAATKSSYFSVIPPRPASPTLYMISNELIGHLVRFDRRRRSMVFCSLDRAFHWAIAHGAHFVLIQA